MLPKAKTGMSSDSPTTADPTRPILAWLESELPADLPARVLALEEQLDALHGASVTSQQFHHCIELFQARALQISTAHRQSLHAEALPLPTAVLTRARVIASALMRVAQGYERALGDADKRSGTSARRFDESVAARAIRLLGENYLVVSQAGLEPDPEIWRLAWRLYALTRSPDVALGAAANPQETALHAYKRLLALPTICPAELSPAELDWSADFLGRATALVHVQEARPPSLDGAWYWLDPANGAEPQACTRREPPAERSLLFFSTVGLARRASELLLRQADDVAPELLPSPAWPGVAPIPLLERLHSRWSMPPRREQNRRRQEYPVQACVGLNAIWNTLRHGKEAELITEWSVLNESPGGYAIMNVQGRAAGLQAGMAIALRRDVSDGWSICVVRWIRSDAVNQVEIGLQMLSRGAIPVRIGFRGSNTEDGTVRALVLPVLPALRQHQAIMAPAGTYSSRRFTLVSDVDRVYVAQCRLLSLDLQTSGVELFQFEIDPYPI